MSELFGNLTHLVLPPLASAYRVPDSRWRASITSITPETGTAGDAVAPKTVGGASEAGGVLFRYMSASTIAEMPASMMTIFKQADRPTLQSRDCHSRARRRPTTVRQISRHP
jgi:hypothetical protein